MDLSKASDFMAMHARPLDRRRFELLTGGGDRDALLAALNAYRNPDGGYGHGLEPDLRSRTSQPGPALHAFEVFAELGPVTAPEAAALCDWLASVTLPDGGLPFALPVPDPAGCAPFWTGADPRASSLQITAVVAAMEHRVAAHDKAVAEHPWLDRATRYCLDAIRGRSGGTRSNWPSRCGWRTPPVTPRRSPCWASTSRRTASSTWRAAWRTR